MNVRIFLTLVLAAIIGIGLLFVGPVFMGQAYSTAAAQNETPAGVGVGKPIPGEYTVWLDDDTPENFIQTQAEIINDTIAKQGGNITHIMKNLKAVNIQGVSNPFVLVNNASNASSIKTVEPVILRAQDRQYVPLGIARAGITMSPGADIDNRESRPNVDIAVLDGGIWGQAAQFHPDLNVYKRIQFEPSAYVGEGFSDHGTHVAGSCCAKDNLAGVVSASPGARIWNLIICAGHNNQANDLGQCGHNGSILAAFDYLVANAASIEIATMSVGGGDLSTSENNAITAVWNAGVTLFVSAGNENTDTQGLAFCSATNVICVSAMGDSDGKCGGLGPSPGSSARWGPTQDDERASFSNYGSEVDIMAPGVNIYSTYPGHPEYIPPNQPAYIGSSPQGAYAGLSGTSMATPIAAGVGGLIKTLNPSFTPNQVKSSMQNNAYSQTLACDSSTGKGGLAHGANSGSSEKILWAGSY